MYDALILTLGFEPGPLIRALASTPLRSNGLVAVLMPEFKDVRSERAFLDFKRIANMMFKNERISIDIKRFEISLKPLSKGVQEVRLIFKEFMDREVAIALTGSMRALILAVFIAYLTIPWIKEPRIFIYLEGRGESVEVPQVRRVLELAVTDVKQEILNALASGPKTITQLSVELGRDRSVIYRHLSWLESRGLIERKGKYVESTELGKALALPQK
ncbi:MAG: hypothetical protein DRO18_06475 [Thermoprotei archaeon]|nr:MAG: hypothetical protein DRO18_06475 [Thermoprotei archaeon]